MQRCDKRITTNLIPGFSQQITYTCGKQVYKGTFCKHHWDRNKQKTTPFGERPGYREPTLNELKSGRLVYAKNMTSYGGHYFRGGFMYTGDRSRNNAPTKYSPDPTLFVIRN